MLSRPHSPTHFLSGGLVGCHQYSMSSIISFNPKYRIGCTSLHQGLSRIDRMSNFSGMRSTYLMLVRKPLRPLRPGCIGFSRTRYEGDRLRARKPRVGFGSFGCYQTLSSDGRKGGQRWESAKCPDPQFGKFPRHASAP